LRTISEYLNWRRPADYREAMAALDLVNVIATEAVREAGEPVPDYK
jgi:hypothetical protein